MDPLPTPNAMTPLTILHISTRLILGGSQENTVLSCEGQARQGHRVHLAFGPIYGPEGSMLDRVRAFNNKHPDTPITTHEVPDLIRELHPLRDRRALKQLRLLIEKLSPDIVHTHSSKAGILGRAAGWASSKSHRDGRPGVIHTIHGPPFMPIPSGIKGAPVRLKNAIYAAAERFAANRCHRIISVADAMTDQFLARRIGTPSLYTTVRSGMETAPYLSLDAHDRVQTRQELNIGADELVFVTVARLAEHKGHDTLIDAIAPLLRTNPTWRLLWVGDGWWRERLEQRLTEAGVADRVTLTGLVPPDRIPKLLIASDVLIHPSEREGLPRTVPQAMLAGLPVIATDVDGTREACIDPDVVGGSEATRTGILVPVNHPAALATAVKSLADGPERRRVLGDRGRTQAAEAFDHDRMVEAIETVYRNVLAQTA